MPKIIELTVELDIQRVSCPGVWLCQDGRVSLTVFALGTSYQTCLLPPTFPLAFKDVFYFRKRFQETCALNNICCLLKDETIYCELVQWCNDCQSGECVILAQYLGALNDVLFPPNMCSNEGVDLLMRRSKDFPGILSPKVEIATKVRIDEVWNQPVSVNSTLKVSPCVMTPHEESKSRQKQVCHSARYHSNINGQRTLADGEGEHHGGSRCQPAQTDENNLYQHGERSPMAYQICWNMCIKHGRSPSMTRSRSRSGSCGSRSCTSLTPKDKELDASCDCPNPGPKTCIPRSPRHSKPRNRSICRDFCVYNMRTHVDHVDAWRNAYMGRSNESEFDDDTKRSRSSSEKQYSSYLEDERLPKTTIESHYIRREKSAQRGKKEKSKNYTKPKISPCVCEICKRYHEFFHLKTKGS